MIVAELNKRASSISDMYFAAKEYREVGETHPSMLKTPDDSWSTEPTSTTISVENKKVNMNILEAALRLYILAYDINPPPTLTEKTKLIQKFSEKGWWLP